MGLEQESRDVQYGLRTTSVMMNENQGWRHKPEEMFSDLVFQKDLLQIRENRLEKAQKLLD